MSDRRISAIFLQKSLRSNRKEKTKTVERSRGRSPFHGCEQLCQPAIEVCKIVICRA